MTTRKPSARKTRIKKLKVKRETIKDLDVKEKAKDLRGGMYAAESEPIKACCPCRSTTRFSDPKVIC